MNKLHRIFVAINLPPNLQKYLADLGSQWSDLPANWVRSENLHITLNFLGNANDEEAIEVCQSTIDIAKRHSPFEILLDRVVYGPQSDVKSGSRPPRMVWAMGEKSQEIGNLQKDLQTSLFEFSGARYQENDQDYAFRPHITLARVIQTEFRRMESEEISAINEKINKIFMVKSIEVMESELRRGGPIYTVLESAKLGCNQ